MQELLKQPAAGKTDPDDNDSVLKALVGVIRQMGLYATIGLTGAVITAKLFEELAEGIFKKESEALDHRFSLWVHSLANPVLDKIFKFFSTIGSIASVVGLTVLSFWILVKRHHPHAAWLLAMATGGGLILNQILKFFFRRPRPQFLTNREPHLKTFSFPSGHATVSFCFCGGFAWLGYKFLKSPVIMAAWLGSMLVCVFMVGLSRVYRGAHYLTDVVGGYISGSFWLALLLSGVSIFDRLHPRKARQSKS
jgi:undecaprenyl-diphosphatase